MEIINPRKEYEVDGNIVFGCEYQVVFCPKYRRNVLEEPIAKRLKELVMENQEAYGYKVFDIEVSLNNVQICLSVSPRIGIFHVICKIKNLTSKVLREEFDGLRSRLPSLWTRKSFFCSVGSLNTESVKKFVENQN